MSQIFHLIRHLNGQKVPNILEKKKKNVKLVIFDTLLWPNNTLQGYPQFIFTSGHIIFSYKSTPPSILFLMYQVTSKGLTLKLRLKKSLLKQTASIHYCLYHITSTLSFSIKKKKCSLHHTHTHYATGTTSETVRRQGFMLH